MAKRITTESNLENVKEFVKRFGDICLRVEEETGVDARAILGQIALETGWGKHILKVIDPETNETIESNNLFNIKCSKNWSGKCGIRKVKEYDKKNNRWFYVEQKFRVYDSYEDSIKDYVNLISRLKRYKKAWENRGDYRKYLEGIASGGYATDPKYVKKIIYIIEKYFVIKDV